MEDFKLKINQADEPDSKNNIPWRLEPHRLAREEKIMNRFTVRTYSTFNREYVPKSEDKNDLALP